MRHDGGRQWNARGRRRDEKSDLGCVFGRRVLKVLTAATRASSVKTSWMRNQDRQFSIGSVLEHARLRHHQAARRMPFASAN